MNRPDDSLSRKAKQARGLNENYARELMELHTLGVDGGYTQQDIIEVARCFTGWTIRQPNRGGEFIYNDRVHDKGEKIVLGVKIPAGGGQDDAEKVLDILARHPSTARFISTELAKKFVADDPPPALIERMAKTFRDTDGDIRAVMSAMLDSKEFFSEGAFPRQGQDAAGAGCERRARDRRASGLRDSSGHSRSRNWASRSIARLSRPGIPARMPNGSTPRRCWPA